jgi:5-methylcytosine-specific restriction endonuclease McrA
VLLLNATYEPLTTVGLKRAVCLVLGAKAEVVHDDTAGEVLHAATVSLVTPSVIRLRRYVRIPHRNRVPLTRGALMRRDNYKCAYCGRHAETIDHVLPRSRGGQHAWENCVAACQTGIESMNVTAAIPPAAVETRGASSYDASSVITSRMKNETTLYTSTTASTEQARLNRFSRIGNVNTESVLSHDVIAWKMGYAGTSNGFKPLTNAINCADSPGNTPFISVMP